MSYKNIIRKEFHNLQIEEVFKLPVDALINVYSKGYAKGSLKEIDIETIFDLATSGVFNNSFFICNYSEELLNNYKQYGQIPKKLVKKNRSYDVNNLCSESIIILDGVSEKSKQYLEVNIGLKTIWDLANWSPFLQAKQLLEGEQHQSKNIITDPEIPDDLVPKFNQYPLDSFSYSVYTMQPTLEENMDANGLKKLEKPLDLSNIEADLKHPKTRLGGLIRFNQTWVSKGLALGDLLHSLPLAPGESTKIAIIDWTRRQGVKVTEDISQLEALSNSVMQTRSLSEITKAVAKEAQTGFSQINSNATVSNTADSSYGLNNGEEVIGAMFGGALIGGLGGGAGGLGGAGIGAVAGSVIPGLGTGIGAVAGGVIGVGSGGIIGALTGGASAALSTANFGGNQDSSSTSEAETITTTSSSGEREITAEMAQTIKDRTLQHASSSRNKKASIIQEVSQSESEKIQTRSITNYNHMHSLTIQYFEVVQIFETKTFVNNIDPCIYIPFNNISEWTPALIKKYKPILIRYTPNINFLNSLIQNKDKVTLKLNLPNNISQKSINSILSDITYQETLTNADRESNSIQYTNIINPIILDSSVSLTTWVSWNIIIDTLQDPAKLAFMSVLSSVHGRNAARMNDSTEPSGDTSGDALPDGSPIPDPEENDSSKDSSPPDTPKKPLPAPSHSNKAQYKVYAEDKNGKIVDLTNKIKNSSSSSISNTKIPLKNFIAIYNEISFPDDFSKKEFNEFLDYRRVKNEDYYSDKFGANGVFIINDGSNDISIKTPCYFSKENINRSNQKIIIKVFNVSYANTEEWQLNHLNENTKFYTKKIFKNLSASEYATLLTPYKYSEKPLVDITEPKPIAVTGNYLIFKLLNADTTTEHKNWLKLLDEEKQSSVALIPVPTGGVFSEAIQGRANSAEKLDISRFWNWQDSPIPHTAPDIAPIQSGSRATDPNVHPSTLSQPIVNISSGNPLPNPQGMSNTLAAVSTSNIFRDMSGIAQTAALAQKALEQATKASTETGGQASKNLSEGLSFTKELASQIIKMAGDYGQSIADTGFGALTSGMNNAMTSASSDTPPADVAFESPSMAGATLNQAKKMDEASEEIKSEKQNEVKDKKSGSPRRRINPKTGPQEKRVQDKLVGGRITKPRMRKINLKMLFHDYEEIPMSGNFEIQLENNHSFFTVFADNNGLYEIEDLEVEDSSNLSFSIFGDPITATESHASMEDYYFRASAFLELGSTPNLSIYISQQKREEKLVTTEAKTVEDFKEALLGGEVEVASGTASSVIAAAKLSAKFETKFGDSEAITNGKSTSFTIIYPQRTLRIKQRK